MKFEKTKLPEVIIIKSNKLSDHRGYFMEFYNRKKFVKNGINDIFVQSNHSYSIKNTLRGLHYQKKYPQSKVVRCTRGKILETIWSHSGKISIG